MFSNLLYFDHFYNKKLSICLYFIDNFILILTYERLLFNSTFKKYYFKYNADKEEIETNNFYLVLNSEAYQADDVNFLEMQKLCYYSAIENEKMKNNDKKRKKCGIILMRDGLP